MKRCSLCGETKSLEDFPKDRSQRDGYRPQCKPCRNSSRTANKEAESERKRIARKRNPEAAREYHRNYYKSRRETISKRNQDYKERNESKARAHQAVRAAVKGGRIRKAACVICGNKDSQGHHDNYARPLDVVWLCSLHHAERHASLDNRIRPATT